MGVKFKMVHGGGLNSCWVKDNKIDIRWWMLLEYQMDLAFKSSHPNPSRISTVKHGCMTIGWVLD